MNDEKKRRAIRWHSVDPGEAVRLLGTNASRGLSRREARRRRRTLGTNQLWKMQRSSPVPLLFGEFLDYAAILLLITAGVAALFERNGDAALILCLLIVSALLRGGTALIARHIFAQAEKENIPRARIIRDGEYLSVFADEVVVGDILILSPGDTAVCDVRLLSGELQVLETALTENRHPVKKSALHILEPQAVCENRSNMVFASSVVVTGTARAAAVATGERTYAFVREGYIPVSSEQKTSIFEDLTGWCRSVSLIMIFAVLLITLGGIFWGRNGASIDSLFLSALALAVASMSEFLCVVANIIFACSMQMLQQSSGGQALVKNSSSVESFAHAACLVFSTEQMLLGEHYAVDRWYSGGVWRNAPEESGENEDLLSLMQMAAVCCGESGFALISPDAEETGEHPDSVLMRKLLKKYGSGRKMDGIRSPAASAESGGMHTVLIPSENGMQAYVCGELRDVLGCCSYQHCAGELRPITVQERQALLSEAETYERRCARTVAVALRMSPYDNLAKASALHNKMTLVGFFSVVNPVELSLVRFVSACRESGMRMAVFTADPVRGRYLSAEAGLLTEKDRFIDWNGSDIVLREWLEEETSSCAVIHTPAGTDRAFLVKIMREYLPELVYAGAEQRDLGACTQAKASVASCVPGKMRPCSLYRRADALAGKETEHESSRSASALETLRIIGYCRGALANLRGAAEYLLLSQTLRLSLTLGAVLLGYPLLSPVLLLVWGLFLDYAAVLSLAFRSPRMADLRLSAPELKLPSIRNGLLFPAALGTFTAVLLAAVPVIGSAIGVEASPSEKVFLIYMGGILASALGAVQCFFSKSAGIHISVSGTVHALLLLLTGCGMWYTCKIQWSGELMWLLLIGMIPAFVLVVLYRIYHLHRNTDKNDR